MLATGYEARNAGSGRRREAFTLVELLVVVAILALLISLLMPTLSRAKEMAKDVLCRTNLRGVGQATSFYAIDNEGVIPVACLPNSHGTPNLLGWKSYWNTWNTFIAEYPDNKYGWHPVGGYADRKSFECPSEPPSKHAVNVRGSYGLNHRMYSETPATRDKVPWVKFIPATDAYHYVMGDATLFPTKMYFAGDSKPGKYVFSYYSTSTNYTADFRHLTTPGEPESGHANVLFHDAHVEPTVREDAWTQKYRWLPWWNRDDHYRGP